MVIPKYVLDILSRSKFIVGAYEPGYTIEISKATPYTWVSSFENELTQLQKWCNKIGNSDELTMLLGGAELMKVIRKPNKTEYCNQKAVVVIYDPVMYLLENYIKDEVVY